MATDSKPMFEWCYVLIHSGDAINCEHELISYHKETPVIHVTGSYFITAK